MTWTLTGTRTGNRLRTKSRTQGRDWNCIFKLNGRELNRSVIWMKVGGHGSEQMVLEFAIQIWSPISSKSVRPFEVAQNRDDWKWAVVSILTLVVEILLETCPLFIFRPCTYKVFFWCICKSNVFCLIELMPIRFKMSSRGIEIL